MKLCLVVNNFPSVSETFIFNKVISLAARGHKVHVVCYKKNPSVDLFEKYTLASSNIFIHEIALNKSASSFLNSLALAPSVFFRSFTFNMKRFRKKYEHNYYIQFINNIDYDILHFEFSGIGVSLLPGMNKFKGKKVVSCRGSAEKFKLLVDEHRKTAQAKLFSKVHLIHCVSEDMKRTISPYCNDTSKIFINTPAIDTDFFKPSGKNSQNVCFQVMSVGRLTFLKGYLVGLLAIKALVEKGIKIEWHIVGEGPDHDEMIFHIDSLKLKDNVKMVGKKSKEEVSELLDRTHVFMLTSYSEGIPNVVLEAMSKELPVVSTRCGGVEEVITHGEDGYIADIYDHSSVAAYIEMLAENAVLRKQIGTAARKKIVAGFRIEKQAEIFEKNYQTIL